MVQDLKKSFQVFKNSHTTFKNSIESETREIRSLLAKSISAFEVDNIKFTESIKQENISTF